MPLLEVGDKIECVEHIPDDRKIDKCDLCIFNNMDCIDIRGILECHSLYRKDRKKVYYKLIKGINND